MCDSFLLVNYIIMRMYHHNQLRVYICVATVPVWLCWENVNLVYI